MVQPLDPDDPRPPFQQVAHALRAAIGARRFAPGDQLPSLNELAKGYGVSLMTVQRALGVLRDEGVIISQQGKGTFVRTVTPSGRDADDDAAPSRAQLAAAVQALSARLDAIERRLEDRE